MRHSISKPGKQTESFLAGLQIHKQMIPNDRVATSYTTSNAVRGAHVSMRPLHFGKWMTQNYANLNDQFNLKLEVISNWRSKLEAYDLQNVFLCEMTKGH